MAIVKIQRDEVYTYVFEGWRLIVDSSPGGSDFRVAPHSTDVFVRSHLPSVLRPEPYCLVQ